MRKELYIKALARCSNDKDEYYAKTIARMSDTIGIKNIEIENLSENVERLEKALDKACEEYVSLCEAINDENLGLYIIVGTKEEWKEQVLEEVQEDE